MRMEPQMNISTSSMHRADNHGLSFKFKTIFKDSEVEEASVIRNFRVTAADWELLPEATVRKIRTVQQEGGL